MTSILRDFYSNTPLLEGQAIYREKLRPVEAQYQYEFYRGVPINSKSARTLDGRVDF